MMEAPRFVEALAYLMVLNVQTGSVPARLTLTPPAPSLPCSPWFSDRQRRYRGHAHAPNVAVQQTDSTYAKLQF